MARRLASEDSDEEFQEIQHARLKNSYRHAREDQREYTIEKKDQLRTQSKTLKQLAQERDELEKVYRLAESLENQKRDEERTKQLQELVRTKDETLREIQNEKAISGDLDAQLREWERKLRQKKAESGGANVSTNFNATVQKRERVLENRLETTHRRFNGLLSANGLSRSEIDNLRNERERFENLFQKSESELRSLRGELVQCIENSVASYEQRKDANSKAIMLQNKADTDKAASEAEMRELERQIAHDRKLQQFMKLKSQERLEDEQLVTYRKRKEAESAEKRRKDREEHSIEAYETKFKQIQEISGEKDLKKLVNKFIQVEDKNFALFNYVNELNNRVETLQEQIDDIKRDIQHFQGQGVELDDHRQKVLERLEHKRSQADATANGYQDKTSGTRKALDQCRTGVDSLFKKIGCDRRQMDHLLQSHEGVTDDNILRYLGIIEERTNELLTAQAAIHAKEQNMALRDRAPNLIGDGPSAPPPQLNLFLPNTDDRRDLDERDDRGDDELKPLTREELKQRASEHVKNLERKAILEHNKYNDSALPSTREKSAQNTTRKS